MVHLVGSTSALARSAPDAARELVGHADAVPVVASPVADQARGEDAAEAVGHHAPG
jgi:hypothetical protein